MGSLVDIQAKHGKLNKEFTQDLSIRAEFSHVFDKSGLGPNYLQASIA
jgi:hypothetical protein